VALQLVREQPFEVMRPSPPVVLQIAGLPGSLASTMKVERPGAYSYAWVRQSPTGEGLK
jgi:hypothetical protein